MTEKAPKTKPAANVGLKELSKIARAAWMKNNPGKEPKPLRTKKDR